MKNKLLLTLCLLFCFTTLSACSHEEDNHVLLPWEKEDSSMGSVSDKTVVPTTPEQDDSLPYWIIPVNKDSASVFYVDDEDRKRVIENSPETYKMLKEAAWNSEDPDVLSNGNIETLIETLSQFKSADRPHITYSQMKVEGLCEHFDQYLGDRMWWDAITIKDCKVIDDETADMLNGGKPYTLVTAETYYEETIYLYVMDADAGMDYYSQSDIQNLEGYPVGISGDAIVLCMVPYDAGNI